VFRTSDPDAGLPSDEVRVVEAGRSVWVGTAAGLAVYTPPLEPPALVAPAAGATEVPTTPLFRWEVAVAAQRYRIQVSTTSDFAAPEREWTPPADASASFRTSLNDALDPERTYYWRVRTENGADASAWSASASFTTGALVATLHGAHRRTVAIDPATGEVWAGGGTVLARYDGATWTEVDDVEAYYPEYLGNEGFGVSAYPTYDVLSVSADGAVWAGAAPRYQVVGDDYYQTNAGFFTRRHPSVEFVEATADFFPSPGYGYPTVAAVDATTAWACEAEYTPAPDLDLDPTGGYPVLQRRAGGATESFSAVAPCLALAADAAGNAWVGGQSGALSRVAPDGTTTAYAAPLLSDVSAVAEGPDGRVWVGTATAGVAVLDPVSEAWTTYTAADAAALGAGVEAFTFGGADVWIGTGAGLVRFSPGGAAAGRALGAVDVTVSPSGTWATWTADNGTLPSSRVLDVAVQPDETAGTATVWAATDGGLVELEVPAGAAPGACPSAAFAAALTLTDGAATPQSATLTLGTAADASDGYDADCDQTRPAPTGSAFSAAFRPAAANDPDHYGADFRALLTAGTPYHIWEATVTGGV
ncbi:MAG: hypothetical protein R3362_12125, partial [Rhodothermales bacterium]|nr:hypothetical protein [Rhodothermales bacterium]